MEKTAAELRIEFANIQRTKKSREKYLEMATQTNQIGRFSEVSTHNGVAIGDIVNFTIKTEKLGGYHISMKEARAFAFGRNTMLVIYLGKIRQVRLSNVEDK
jgi:hypothetical protein